MNLAYAQIISELLTNAGYLDDADELLADRLEEAPAEEVMEFAKNVDGLIAEVNAVLPPEEQISLKETMVDIVNSMI